MKKFKILFLLTLIASVFFYSCNKDNANDIVTEKSLSLRMTLQEIKKSMSDSGKSSNTSDDSEMCFDFVYPITLSYNTGTIVVVNSFEEIVTLLETETEDNYLEGIAFPFQVISAPDGTITTINTEDDFNNLVVDCGYDTYDDTMDDSDCFELIYPFSVVNLQNQVTVINNETELNNVLDSLDDNDHLLPVFPFSVMQNGQIVVLNNEYELYELADSCDDDDDDCVCTEIYQPVCVVLPDGTLYQYANSCFAECEGFDSSYFVNCN